ncbi:MAG: hypothetical protein ACKOXF_12205, partial [Chitinophagaceae bacterium]
MRDVTGLLLDFKIGVLKKDKCLNTDYLNVDAIILKMNKNNLNIPPGWNGHFITIVTHERQNYFGEIENGEMC